MRVAAIILACLLTILTLTACMGSRDDDPDPSPAATAIRPSPTITIVPTSTPTATPEVTTSPLDAGADHVLGLVPVKPANIDLFTSDYLENPVYPEAYPEGSPMEPAIGVERSAQTMRNALRRFLISGLGSDAPEVAATLALYDDPAVIKRAPDPLLRAAFVSLNVTIAAPLIDSFLLSDVYGGNLSWVDSGLAFTESSTPGPEGKQYIGISERFQFEDFTAIAPNIVHAMLHHDETFSYSEDVIVVTISTVVYLQLVELDPSIVYQGTELCRFNNTFALALLNSHRAGSPDIELIVPGGTSVLPGSPDDAPDFWSMIAESDSTSDPAPSLLLLLDNMLEPGTMIPASLRFDPATAELIGGRIDPAVLSPAQRVRLSVLLTMISTDEIAALLDLTREETIELFDLAPIEEVLAANS